MRRHHDLRIVHRSRGPRLLSGPWSMAVVQCHETAADMEERVLCLKHDVEQGRQFSPPAIWRRLSTPMEHPGAARQDDPDAFQRVLVCSAVGTSSFDLVNWLGERHAARSCTAASPGPMPWTSAPTTSISNRAGGCCGWSRWRGMA